MRNIRMPFFILALAFIANLNSEQAHAAMPSIVKAKCASCHSFEQGAKYKTGPNLYDIVGKKAGTSEGYRYGASLREASFIWTPDKLSLWLADSKQAIKELTGDAAAKTKMPAQRLSGAKLDAVITYLVSISPKPRMAKMSRTMNTMAVAPRVSAKNGVSHAVPKSMPVPAGRSPAAAAEPPMAEAMPAPTAAPAAPTSSPVLKRRVRDTSASVAPSRAPASVQPKMAEPEGDPTAGLPATAAGVPETMPAAPNGHSDTRVRMGARAPSAVDKGEKYKVELGADSVISMPGTPGELRVWIGFPEYESTISEGMNRARGEIAALSDTARVTPFSTSLKIKPEVSDCVKIHPTGITVRFELTPEKAGVFNVGADINLYDSEDCSGLPIPKAAETLQVEVRVDTEAEWGERKDTLFDIAWEKFVEFWGAVVALFFGTVLFLLRKKLKRWFGYEE